MAKEKGGFFVGGMLMLGLLVPFLNAGVASASTSPAVVTDPPVPGPALQGTCTYVGNLTLALHNAAAQTGMHFECSGAPTITYGSGVETVTYSNGTVKPLNVAAQNAQHPSTDFKIPIRPDLSGQHNNYIKGNGVACNTDCTETFVSETSTMVPNTAQWSIQDNAYGYGGCLTSLNYQNVPIIGTSSDSYTNTWGVANLNYSGLCGVITVTENFYSFLTGINLNSGESFETWYTLNSGGVPTTAWLTVYLSNGNIDYYSVGMPSNNPNIGIGGWQQNVVCSGGGCYTTFSSGGGSISYYQNGFTVAGTPTLYYTGENSNCNYGSVTSHSSYGTQSFSC